MQINQEKVQERLATIPDSHRSHIYDATIILEFLFHTFTPTKFFLPPGFTPTPGMPLGPVSMKKLAKVNQMMMRDLYDLYLLFREEKDYTRKIESRYIFSIIIRNLRYYKNGWEFSVYRVGAAQIWHVGPLLMRTELTVEQRKEFPKKMDKTDVEAILVEADPVADPEVEDEVPDDRFEEAVFELPDEPVINNQPTPVEDY